MLKKKRINYLRSIWGRPIDRHRDFDLISNYHNLLKQEKADLFVDDKTWDDLGFDLIFSKMDRNISGIGQQYLYHLLHKYEKDESILRERFKLISNLKDDRDLREEIQLNLFNLKGTSSYFTSYLVLSKSLPYTKFYPLFYLCSFISVLSLVLIAVDSFFLFIALAVLVINLLINKILSNKIYSFFAGFSSLNSLIVSAFSIGKIKTKIPVPELKLLRENRGLLKSLKKKLGYLVIDKESLNDLILIAIEYLNMFMLFDIISYYRSVDTLLKNQNEIRRVFESVASLDASISVASYLSELKYFTNPKFNSSGEIDFDDLCHPLIDNVVPNSIHGINSSVLITGSNMSGKTTFIKTVGINFILAQTLYFSLTKSFNIPAYFVKTSIRRNEDLEGGKSYFFVEIEELKKFIEMSVEKNRYLFLIDEIFRGTNTIERLASSTAVLKYLSNGNRVFVTTHDIELQELLENSLMMFHFSEQVEGDRFFFNYKIKKGPCSSGNAIKLLEIMKYPDIITKEANAIVKELLLNSSLTYRIKS